MAAIVEQQRTRREPAGERHDPPVLLPQPGIDGLGDVPGYAANILVARPLEGQVCGRLGLPLRRGGVPIGSGRRPSRPHPALMGIGILDDEAAYPFPGRSRSSAARGRRSHSETILRRLESRGSGEAPASPDRPRGERRFRHRQPPTYSEALSPGSGGGSGSRPASRSGMAVALGSPRTTVLPPCCPSTCSRRSCISAGLR